MTAVGIACLQVPVARLTLVAAAAGDEALADAAAGNEALQRVGVRLALAAVLRTVRVAVTCCGRSGNMHERQAGANSGCT